MKKSLFLFFLSAAFFTAALFADDEPAQTAPQKEETQSEEVKAESQAEPAAETEAAPQEDAKVEENAASQSESAPEKDSELEADEAAAIQSAQESKIEVEVVRDAENSGKYLVFSARSLDKMTWNEAQDFCKGLKFYGEEWRLPNIDELRELVRNCPATEPGGSCRVSDEGNCLAGNCSTPKDSCTCERKPKNRGFYSMFGDADYIGLWSSSTLSNDDKKAWGTVFYSGMIGTVGKEAKLYARCVYNAQSVGVTKNEEKTEKIELENNGIVSVGKKGGKAVVSGKVDKNKFDIDKYIDEKNSDISHCVYRGLKEDKDLSHGMVAIDFMIAETGEVVYSNVKMSTTGNLTVENCIAETIKKVKFPALGKDTTIYVNERFRFHAIRRKK
ncbi:DUF1566 domain-containing protein [bacterium]|nr:DUF1566 domain-containing protein [bacterium]